MLKLWNFIKTKEGLLSVIITLFVVAPLIIFIVMTIKGFVYKTFNIKTDAEIKAEQKVVIDNMEHNNKELKQTIQIKDKIKKLDENKTITVIRKEKKIDKKVMKLKEKVISTPTKKEVEQLKLITKNKHVVKDKPVKNDEIIIINKTDYQLEGLKNINAIYDMYNSLKDEE